MDQNRGQQRSKYTPAQHVRATSGDVREEHEYEDVWPPRMSTSTRRYQADVTTEVGRTEADIQPLASQRTYQTNHTTGRTTIVPPRRTATQTNLPAVRDRRTATQTNLPAVQDNRRSAELGEVSRRHSDRLPETEVPSKSRPHWLVFTGIAMFAMVIVWVVLTAVSSWWQVTQDDWHYGRPRTYQVDMVVGHTDSPTSPSHFIALNLHRHVQVIEFPGGDSSKAKMYVGPTLLGSGQDLAVVTLSFKDVNGDGRLDMIINIQDSHFVFINDNGQFRPLRPGENVQLGT